MTRARPLALALGLCVFGSTLALADVAPPPPLIPEPAIPAPAPAAPAPAAPAPAAPAPAAPARPPLPREADRRIALDKARITYDDGDSFKYGAEDIRILGMDTPEIIHEAHGIYQDQPYGREALAFTRSQMEAATLIEYLPCGKDPYGRTLAHVFVDGELLSIRVIKAGLAYENISRYGDNGTPELAKMILEGAKGLPTPPFQDPADWRKANRKKK